jgi:hypothetical protein
MERPRPDGAQSPCQGAEAAETVTCQPSVPPRWMIGRFGYSRSWPSGVFSIVDRLGAAGIGSFSLLGRNIELVTAEADHYHVNIPITGGTDSRSGRLERVQVTPQRAAVFMPGLPADIGWRGDCAQFCLMFPHRRLHHELAAMLHRPLARPIEFAPAMDLTTDRGRVMLGTIIRTPVAGK